jgi:hypothetical protein
MPSIEADARTAVIDAVRAASTTEPDDSEPAAHVTPRESLRSSVRAYVRLLRDSGLQPEQTIVQVKEAVQSVSASPVVKRRLMNDIISWCIEAYYP